MRAKIPQETREQQIREICVNENYEFLGWVTEYTGVYSKCQLKCLNDGNIWEVNVHNLINNHRRCHKCFVLKHTHTEASRAEQIEKICLKRNLQFKGFVGEYRNATTKLLITCVLCNSTWSPSINNFINNETSCPSCSQHGFNPSKPGSFYIQELVWEGTKYIKFGISHNVASRIKQQKRLSKCEHTLLYEFRNSGDIIQQIESKVKESVDTKALSKEVLPDGYTETCSFVHLETILDIVNNTGE